MSLHTTNYTNTLIEVAEDCPAKTGIIPALKGEQKSVAGLQFELIYENPYIYTSDDVLFEVFAKRRGIDLSEYQDQKRLFFSKGQPCFRASPLCKKYGFGVHSDVEGRIALFGVETAQYSDLKANDQITKVRAMRSKKL